MLTGWSSCDEENWGGGDGGAEERNEDAGHEICGDETGCRGKGMSADARPLSISTKSSTVVPQQNEILL